MKRSPSAGRGFTLLEVMISLAILAVSLVAISGLNGGAVAMESYARRATAIRSSHSTGAPSFALRRAFRKHS